MKRFLLSIALATAICGQVHALETPQPGKLDARVTSVVYQANNVVRIDATYGISTMLIFDEDEKFETISLGDSESWQVAPTEKGNILFIKPIAKDVVTNLNVVTSKRIYFLELHDYAPEAGKKKPTRNACTMEKKAIRKASAKISVLIRTNPYPAGLVGRTGKARTTRKDRKDPEPGKPVKV